MAEQPMDDELSFRMTPEEIEERKAQIAAFAVVRRKLLAWYLGYLALLACAFFALSLPLGETAGVISGALLLAALIPCVGAIWYSILLHKKLEATELYSSGLGPVGAVFWSLVLTPLAIGAAIPLLVLFSQWRISRRLL